MQVVLVTDSQVENATGDVVPSYQVAFTLEPDGPQWTVNVAKQGADVVGRVKAAMQAVANEVGGIKGIT